MRFFNAKIKERVYAHMKLIIRQIIGKKVKIEKMILCEKCHRYAIAYCYIETSRKEILVYPIGDILENGMHRKVIYTKERRNFNICFKVKGNTVMLDSMNRKFYGNLCPECYWKVQKKKIKSMIHNVYKLFSNANLILPPFEAYWSEKKFIIRLPKKRYVFSSKYELDRTIEDNIYQLCKNVDNSGRPPENLIEFFKDALSSGFWQILELSVLIKCRDMRKKMKTIANFNDVLSLVAYVEKKSIRELLSELKDKGMLLSTDKTLGFTVESSGRPNKFKRIIPQQYGSTFRYGNIVWKIPRVYLKFLRPLSFGVGKYNVLRIKTKYCIIYVVPSFKALRLS